MKSFETKSISQTLISKIQRRTTTEAAIYHGGRKGNGGGGGGGDNQVLLISDPDTDKCAASMNVGVGSYSDPEGLEGLAHFLEHMLFYASEKYPLEDSYSTYISEHGGRTNAYTSAEHTNYFFDVNADCFDEALDRVKTNPKNAINEHFLPRFLDFIVWGHEHECLVDPQEVPSMSFHSTQPGSSVATSLIDGESKPKHALLVEIKGNQYRPTKIPLNSVRPFEYKEVVLSDEPDIDLNDQSSVLEHLDNVVNSLIEKCNRRDTRNSKPMLPLIRVKVDYSGFMTINPQRFGQNYVGKVANPQDILIFSKASKRAQCEAKIKDSERLRPEELNQQNIEALVAESQLKMEILPINDLDEALQNFVNKDDKMVLDSCMQYNIEETRKSISRDPDITKVEVEDIIVKVENCLEERVKGRSRSKDYQLFTSSAQSMENLINKAPGGTGSAVSFSDDEETTQYYGTKSTGRGKKGSLQQFQSARDVSEVGKTASRRGRGRGRGSNSLKQTTLDAAFTSRRSERSASVAASASVQSIAADEENVDSDSEDEPVQYGINELHDSSVTRNYGALRR